MNFKVIRCAITYREPDWQRQFVLSKNRLLKNLRQRIVDMTVCCVDNSVIGRGTGEIFDSVLWANPVHINTVARSEIDLIYLSELSEIIVRIVSEKEFENPFDFEKKLYEAAKNFTNAFQEENKYIVPDTLYYMALMPFSIACFAAYENATKENIYEAVFHGKLNDAFYSFYRFLMHEDAGDINISGQHRKQIPWLMTLDISSSYENIEQSVRQYHPRQLKVKVDNDTGKINRIIQNLIKIHQNYSDVTFYFDGNRSFNTVTEFQNNFLNKIAQQEPAILNKIIGLEEISQDLLVTDKQIIEKIPYDIFIDENASSVKNIQTAAEKSLGVVIKASKPLGFLLVQYMYCIKHRLKMTVQDLTFWGNAYFANLALYDYIPTSIGLEANYCLFVDSDWGKEYPEGYKALTRIVDGNIFVSQQSIAVFPDNNS